MRSFVGNLTLLLALNFLVKPFYILGIEAEVQNRVGSEVYGSYFALISFSFLLNILLDMGVTNFNTRNIARDSSELKKHFGGLTSVRLLLLFLYIAVVLILGLSIGYSGTQIKILFILALNQGFAASILYLRSNLTGLHLFKQDSVVSVLDRLLLIAMMAALLWGGITTQPFDIEWFVYGQSIAYFITMVVALLLVTRHTGKFRLKFDLSYTSNMLKKSFPYALLIFLMMVYYKTDSVMLERMIDDNGREAGTYAMGYRFFEAANMIAYLFAIILLPVYSTMIKKGQDVGKITSLAFRLLFGGALILSTACFFWDEDIMNWRYLQDTTEAAAVFGLLMFSFLAFSATYIFGTMLTANGNLRALNTVAVIAVAINIVLNVILIPTHQAYGAAIASLVTQVFVAVCQLIIVQRTFKFNANVSLLTRLVLFAAGLLAGVYFLQDVHQFWFVNLALFSVAAGLWSVITGVINLGGLKRLLSLRSNQ
jgi:O-antigen/teichoic acid export membrane protein